MPAKLFKADYHNGRSVSWRTHYPFQGIRSLDYDSVPMLPSEAYYFRILLDFHDSSLGHTLDCGNKTLYIVREKED